MKQLKRSSQGLAWNRLLLLAFLTGAVSVGGMVLHVEPQAAAKLQSGLATPVPTGVAIRATLGTVSPFGPPVDTHPVSQMAQSIELALADQTPFGPMPTASVAEGTPEPGNSQESAVAPADLKDIPPPRLVVTPVPAPSDIDADGQNSSATALPTRIQVPVESLSTTRSTLGASGGSSAEPVAAAGNGGAIGPAATLTTVSVYTPAQIRQAYGFAALPAATVTNKATYQGSGQTIVIVDAYHDATAGADLNTFSTKFGLPTCSLILSTFKAGTPVSALVASPKPGDGCSFQVLYANSAGGQAATAPAANSGWATEISLDVQWAHAIAPMAKIVLVEAASSGGNDMMNAMLFASKLGGGSVSMSYSTPEFPSGPSYDWIMTGTGITWVAASGDSGAGANWPASSKNVLAVGGTLLNNVSPRAEAAWTGSGGGLSKYIAMPAWQSTVTIPGNPANAPANAAKMRRGVPDVAYNASPYSSFYIYQSGIGYESVGGTSAGTPQWAALVAIVNGVRTLMAKTSFGGTTFQQSLYGTAAAGANYKATFLDVTTGGDGMCKTCAAAVGYDLVTGLGTPNIASIVGSLTALK